MTKKETESERARAKAIREQLPQDLQAKITELDHRLVNYLAQYDQEKLEGEEDNTAIRDLRKKVAEVIASGSIHPSQGTIGPAPKVSTLPDPQANTVPSPAPEPITQPSVTRPTLEALAASRTEPDSSKQEKDFRSPPPHSAGRILLVEDNESIRTTIEEILREQGYRVCVAENGKEGIKRLFQMGECDLILLDLMLPVLSGFDFLDIFDENPAWTMPVVVLSAHMKDADYHPAEDGGLEVFIGKQPREALKKPIYLEGFLKAVEDKVRLGKIRRKT